MRRDRDAALMRRYAYARRGRVWLSYDVDAIVMPRLRILCEGEAPETRTLEVVAEISARHSDPVVMIAVDLVDSRVERPVAAAYWAVTDFLSYLRKRLACNTHTEQEGTNR